jgi:hypothetical protein
MSANSRNEFVDATIGTRLRKLPENGLLRALLFLFENYDYSLAQVLLICVAHRPDLS